MLISRSSSAERVLGCQDNYAANSDAAHGQWTTQDPVTNPWQPQQ